MFLIDDKLYKKAILQEDTGNTTNLKTIIPNSIYLNPVGNSQQQLASDSESINKIMEKDQNNSIDTYEVSRPTTGSSSEGKTVGDQEQMSVHEATASKGFVPPFRINENKSTTVCLSLVSIL